MIKYFNRKTKQYEIEQIAAGNYLKWTYSSPVGMKFLELIIKKKIFSKLYGYFCNSKFSKRKIYPFIQNFNINMNDYEKNYNKFKCFNDFFSRTLKDNARSIDMDEKILVSPGDGRLQVYENIDLDELVQIKGYTYSLYNLICNMEIAKKFDKGTCLILRLCPTDYHRFHFIDHGVCDVTSKIKGDYYSVNPIALKNIPHIFCKNKREWSIFHSKNFGDLLYIEVGATCVGTIVQTYFPGKNISKGDEKGYFKFGGSTVILFFQQNKVKIHKDLLEQSSIGYETKVLMGEGIGSRY
ncbi:phosphatidylserine decarboxylase [Clostridium sp. WILCCON 0269]|uniref:Phosphatidylserine decarboxylase proenzyme n=1 Tax=Candidatus Clostridium eludens TaxID=3381663 RepID=A0ABW8SGU0_9CLOT